MLNQCRLSTHHHEFFHELMHLLKHAPLRAEIYILSHNTRLVLLNSSEHTLNSCLSLFHSFPNKYQKPSRSSSMSEGVPILNNGNTRQRMRGNSRREFDPENGAHEKPHIPGLEARGFTTFTDRFLRRGKRQVGIVESFYNIATSSCGYQISEAGAKKLTTK